MRVVHVCPSLMTKKILPRRDDEKSTKKILPPGGVQTLEGFISEFTRVDLPGVHLSMGFDVRKKANRGGYGTDERTTINDQKKERTQNPPTLPPCSLYL